MSGTFTESSSVEEASKVWGLWLIHANLCSNYGGITKLGTGKEGLSVSRASDSGETWFLC